MSSEIAVFAETNFRNQRRKFGIKRDDRRRHMYLVGKTGMGKSTMLENAIISDIRAGHGVAVVDPHGDLAEKILEFIPTNRVNDVIYFNPSDTKYPIAFNILESIGEDYKHLVAYGLVGVFKKIWADSWGPRMEYIMTNTILALLEYPGSTLLGLMRMLVDKAYRKKVVDKVTDPVVKTFWADEYANYSEKFRTEAIAPIQNKVGQFLASAIIRNIVGQSKSTIEMRDVMDNQKILIMNLAKGRIGEENSALLGAMMITKLQIAAMSRVDIPEEERKDFYLYVDEFQNFATDSFAGILSEARKYRLCLIMAHQYFEQLGDVVKAAVFGNVGTMIVFRVGATDAAELELEFAPQFLPADIVNLKKYTVCMRLMVDGVATEPFSAIGLPPATGATDNKDKVIKVSRERYARPQAVVEDRIIRWSGVQINRPNVNPEIAPTTSPKDDEMDWPDQIITAAEPELSDDDKPAKMSKEGVQLTVNEAEATNGQVDTSNFIPGEVPAKPIQVEQTKPNKPAVVELAKAIKEDEVENNNASTRPRISFINHQLRDLAPSPSPSAGEGSKKVDLVVDEDNDDEFEDVPDDEIEPIHPVGAIHELPLQALKNGTAPRVVLEKPVVQQPKPQNVQPTPTGDGQKRKRRRRRRNRGGELPQQVPPQPNKPVQPQPVKPKPITPPQINAPANKVSWKDLLE
ncbi:MAG: type IV secretion system DNA-binding domain-containing protein [Patescibacteria group bacterium]